MKKQTYTIKQGSKPVGSSSAGDTVSLTKKQAAAFRDRLVLTPTQLKDLEIEAKAIGFIAPNTNAIPPEQKLARPPFVEDEDLPDSTPPGGSDKGLHTNPPGGGKADSRPLDLSDGEEPKKPSGPPQ